MVKRSCLKQFEQSFSHYEVTSDYDPISSNSDEVKAAGPQNTESRSLQRAADAIETGWLPGASMGYRFVLESRGLQERFEAMCRGRRAESEDEENKEERGWILVNKEDSI